MEQESLQKSSDAVARRSRHKQASRGLKRKHLSSSSEHRSPKNKPCKTRGEDRSTNRSKTDNELAMRASSGVEASSSSRHEQCDKSSTKHRDRKEAPKWSSSQCKKKKSVKPDKPAMSKAAMKQLRSKMVYRPYVFSQFGHQMKSFGLRMNKEHFLKNGLFKFSVTSYNVLSQDLIVSNSYLYGHCDWNHLQWEYRKKNFITEFDDMRVDVICLQEVHYGHYESFFKPELEKRGYEGFYIKRRGDKLDGCATFVNTKIFVVEKHVLVQYFRRDIRVLDRDNVALLVLLKFSQMPEFKLCVSNTHLLFNARRGDVKLAQLMMLLAEVDQLAYSHADESGLPVYHPVIMCGDFNYLPYCDLYDLITRGQLQYQGLVIGKMAGSFDSGYNWSLVQDFLSKSTGITDQCQYLHNAQQRMLERLSSLKQQMAETAAATNTSGVPLKSKHASKSQETNGKTNESETVVSNDVECSRSVMPIRESCTGDKVATTTVTSAGSSLESSIQLTSSAGYDTKIQTPVCRAMSSGEYWDSEIRQYEISNSDGKTFYGKRTRTSVCAVTSPSHEQIPAQTEREDWDAEIRLLGYCIDRKPTPNFNSSCLLDDPGLSGYCIDRKPTPNFNSSCLLDDPAIVACSNFTYPTSAPNELVPPKHAHVTFNTGRASHRLNLVSAYTHSIDADPEVSTNHQRANYSVDYIFYSKNPNRESDHSNDATTDVDKGEIRLISTKKLLSAREMMDLNGLPNAVASSDHLRLSATFVLGCHEKNK